MNDILTLADAGALAAILSAAGRKAVVGRLAVSGNRVLYGQAQYIGGRALMLRNMTAESRGDVRELFLNVQLPQAHSIHISWRSWLVRELIAEYRDGRFIVDFDLAAFEAAGGQAAVPGSVARWRAQQP